MSSFITVIMWIYLSWIGTGQTSPLERSSNGICADDVPTCVHNNMVCMDSTLASLCRKTCGTCHDATGTSTSSTPQTTNSSLPTAAAPAITPITNSPLLSTTMLNTSTVASSTAATLPQKATSLPAVTTTPAKSSPGRPFPTIGTCQDVHPNVCKQQLNGGAFADMCKDPYLSMMYCQKSCGLCPSPTTQAPLMWGSWGPLVCQQYTKGDASGCMMTRERTCPSIDFKDCSVNGSISYQYKRCINNTCPVSSTSPQTTTTSGGFTPRPSTVASSTTPITTSGGFTQRPSTVTSTSTSGGFTQRPSTVTSTSTSGGFTQRPSTVTSTITSGGFTQRPSTVLPSSILTPTNAGGFTQKPTVIASSTTTKTTTNSGFTPKPLTRASSIRTATSSGFTPRPTPVTTTTTAPVPTTPPNTHFNAVTCKACDGPPDFCEILYTPVTCQPPNNFCINEVINKNDGSRTVIRRCGNYDECYNNWYRGSSDNDRCQRFDGNQVYTLTFDCTYCCLDDNCNEPLKPAKNLLYRP